MQHSEENRPLLNVDYIAMGKRVRMARNKRRLSQVETARIAKCSSSYYGHIERGSRKASIETLFHVSQVLFVSLDYLLYGEEMLDQIHAGCENPDIVISADEPVLYALVQMMCQNKDEWLKDNRKRRHRDGQ